MIRVMLFLDPGGVTPIDQWEVMGQIDIENTVLASVQSKGKRGSYKCHLYKKRKSRWMTLTLRDFPRKSYHPWEMVRRILNQAAENNGGKI